MNNILAAFLGMDKIEHHMQICLRNPRKLHAAPIMFAIYLSENLI
jgi:hypothetical protein